MQLLNKANDLQCGLVQKQKDLCSTVSRARKCCCFYLGYFICKQLKFTKRVQTSDFSIQSCFVIFFVPLQFQNVKVKTDWILTMKRKKTRLAIHETFPLSWQNSSKLSFKLGDSEWLEISRVFLVRELIFINYSTADCYFLSFYQDQNSLKRADIADF